MAATDTSAERASLAAGDTGPAGASRYPVWLGPTAAGLIVTLAYVQLALRNWANFAVNAYDTGIMSQVVASYARFQVPHSTIKGYPNILADHFSPILATWAPLWWIWPDPRVLLLAQAALLGLGAAGIYVVARRSLSSALVLVSVALFATWRGTQSGGGFDVHEVVFFVPLTIWAVERGLAGKWRTAWLLAACMLLVREDGGLMLTSFALWAFTRGRRKDALLGLVAGVGATLAIAALLKHLDSRLGFPGYFPLQNLGPTPLAALQHIVTHPGETLRSLYLPSVKFETIVGTLRPYLYLPLLSPMVIMFIPQLLLRLLGGRDVLWTLSFHYSLPIAGVLTLAYIDGVQRINRWLEKGKTAAVAIRRKQIFEVILVVAATVTIVFNLTGGQLVSGTPSNMLPEYHASCRAAIAGVPNGARVAASNSTAAYLVARAHVRLWRGGAQPGEYVLVGPPGENGHLGQHYTFAVKRITALAVPVTTGPGCRLFHYTGSTALPELITIAQIQPDPTGKTSG